MSLATETQFTDAGAAPVQAPLTPAELAPHFPQLEILECLGRGGMGVVYKARQKTLNRVVALKLLAPERVPDAGFAERFTREAQALARLNHPNIVTIHDFGCTRAGDLQSPPLSTLNAQLSTSSSGFYFLLMEFVDGVNLRQAMRAGRFTPEQALIIVPPVCEALHYAHEQGIVHRDIKPENLLLDKTGRVKIADFGIAKMLETGRAELPLGHSTEAAQQRGPTSQESFVAGTPQYMAPEQKADPQHADHRADIYSLGVVLYEMLTGELPGKELQPPSKRVQVDVRIDEIVLRALETKPELRYATAAEFRTQVENLTDSAAGSDPARPGEPAWFKPVGLLYVLAGLLGWLPTVASLGTHVVTHHAAVMLSATGLALLTRHRWWRWLAIGTNTLAIANYLFGHAVVLGLASLDRIPSGSPWPNDMGGVAREIARHAPDNLLFLAGFGCGIWLLFRGDARAAFASQRFTQREHNVICGLAVAALVGSLLSFVWPQHLVLNLYAHLVKAAGVFGLAAWCLFRGGTAAAPLRPSLAWGISLRVLAAVVAIGLVLCVGFLVTAGLYRTREATMMAQRAALAAKQQMRDALGSQDPSVGAPQTNSAATASPITSSIGASDNSPEAIAAAQQRGITAATRDFQAGIFRILRYGVLMRTDGTETDEETGFRIQWVAGSILSNQFRAEADAYNFAMRDRYWTHEHWKRKAATAPPVAAGDDSKLNAVTRTFPLRHKLASDMVDDLRQILLGRPGHEAKPAANNQEILITAPPEVLTRAQTFITVTDWPDTITRGSNYEYPRQTVLRAARSFFYACALEDATEAISKLLSLHVLAQLKGDTKSSHYENYSIGGVPDAEWEKTLRADWPGKQEAIQGLVREWNRYPLKRLTEESGIAIGFGVKHFCSVAFEGAPKEFYQVTIEPDRTKPRGADGATFHFSSLPPWWKDASATNTTAMDFRVVKVEAPPGLRDIRVQFQCAAPAGFGFEVCQDVTRGPYGETPKSKDAFWLRTKWVGLNDPPVLVWTLPEDFTPAEVQAGAKQVEAHLRTMRDALRMLPTEAVSSFGKVRHREGWIYELVLRVKSARDHSPVQAADAWVVEGTVRDGEGKPVPEADIHVSSGAGSLFVTGKGKTGPDGTYRVGFGPGISMSAGDRRGAMQTAIVHVGKPGFEEKELGTGGNLQMAWELTPQQLAGGWQPGPQKTFLPGKPLRVDFVLLPAATVRGTLLTPDGKPLPNRTIVLVGDRLRPASSIYASAKTDADGRFTFKDVSTQHAWSFSIEKTPHHRKRTAPDRFAEARVHEITLIAEGDELRRGDTPPAKRPEF